MPVYVLRNFVFGRRQLGLSTLSGYRLDYRSVVPAVASVGFRYRLSSPHLFFFFIPPRRWSESKKPQTLRERRWLYKIHGCTCSSITSFYFHSIRHSYGSGRVNITFYFIIIFLCSRCSCVLERFAMEAIDPPPVSTPAFAARTRAWCYPWLAPLVSSQCFVSA